jgi:hypothetical protein
MELTSREKDKLLLFTAALLAGSQKIFPLLQAPLPVRIFSALNPPKC